MADRERRPANCEWGALKCCNLLEEDDILARQGKVNNLYNSLSSHKASFFINKLKIVFQRSFLVMEQGTVFCYPAAPCQPYR
jgi:hypothetical protein